MILIDSNKQCIQLDSGYSHLRISAEKRTELSHFCKLSSAYKILSTKALLCNNLNNFVGTSEYEKRGIDASFLGCTFMACLSHGTSNDLWSDFGDNHRGVKFLFKYNGAFHDAVFDKKRKVKAYSKNGNLIAELGFCVSLINSRNIFSVSNFNTDVVVDLLLSDVDYTNVSPDSTFKAGDKRFLNLSNFSRTVLQTFASEFETRIICILRSTRENMMDEIDHLLIPIDFSRCSINLIFGKKVKPTEKTEMIRRLNQVCSETV